MTINGIVLRPNFNSDKDGERKENNEIKTFVINGKLLVQLALNENIKEYKKSW